MSIDNDNHIESTSGDTGTPHKRRVRYSGTHPVRFEDRYKEHDPLRYAETVEKVISKGSTPAGMHIPIMVDEILDVLKIEPGEQGLDATLGYGGHTSRMLSCLDGRGHLYGLDVDSIEIKKTEQRLRDAGYGQDIFTPVLTNFADIDQVADKYGKFDFVLADLGVSSMQIDDPKRGFTYKHDGPLDLRLDPEHGVTAAQRLKELKKDEIEWMLTENSDEPYAKEIAKEITNRNKKRDYIETTSQLKEVIEQVLEGIPKKDYEETLKKTCMRTFQALRIDINSEFEVLEELLTKLPEVLKPGGRVAILTFHSGEDRLVKQYFKMQYRDGLYSDIARDVTRPSKEECIRNPRSHSTKLRWAIKA